jgi:hypothetical protein
MSWRSSRTSLRRPCHMGWGWGWSFPGDLPARRGTAWERAGPRARRGGAARGNARRDLAARAASRRARAARTSRGSSARVSARTRARRARGARARRLSATRRQRARRRVAPRADPIVIGDPHQLHRHHRRRRRLPLITVDIHGIAPTLRKMSTKADQAQLPPNRWEAWGLVDCFDSSTQSHQ